MPKAGFKSITVTDYVYDQFQIRYNKIKDELQMQGITNFSGFIIYKMNQILKQEETK